jgi:hypothetical protein
MIRPLRWSHDIVPAMQQAIFAAALLSLALLALGGLLLRPAR